jgi:hypothetical protein
MSRIVTAGLCAILALGALIGAPLIYPAPALAATGTLTVEAPLQEAPQDGAAALALLPQGTVVAVDGAPVDGFYPVTAEGLSGWVRGETLLFEEEGGTATGDGVPAPEQTGEAPSADPATSTEAEATAPESPATDIATDATATDSGPEAAPATEAGTEPMAAPVQSGEVVPEAAPVDAAPDQPLFAATPDVETAAPGEAVPEPEPRAGELVVQEPAPDPNAPANPSPLDAGTTAPPVEDAGWAPTPAPNAPSVPVPDPGPTGPADVTAEAPILAGPGAEYGLIFTAPLGSRVEQTGHQIGGYVTIRYAEVTGWAPLDHLGPPIADAVAPVAAATPVQ